MFVTASDCCQQASSLIQSASCDFEDYSSKKVVFDRDLYDSDGALSGLVGATAALSMQRYGKRDQRDQQSYSWQDVRPQSRGLQYGCCSYDIGLWRDDCWFCKK